MAAGLWSRDEAVIDRPERASGNVREIVLPASGWTPRPYQRALWRYLEGGGKRAVAVWHRRAGKDDVALHWTAVSAMQRVGNYWHMLPEAAQARKAIWGAVNSHTGKRRIDEAFPRALRKTTRENDMSIEFVNGSTWQVVGSDNYDSLVGAAPVGIVFSEWALADPHAWAYLRPILRENDGWALFIYTPRGRNHGATFYDGARLDAEWFAEKLDATQTGVFTPEQLRSERAEYIRDFGTIDGAARYEQEYLSSFDAAIVGAYYASEMQAADNEGRITRVPHQPGVRVDTWWDLGIDDATVIWFAQHCGREIHLIDYIEGTGRGLDSYASEMQRRPYVYGEHLLPHDGGARELGAGGRTREETLRTLGLKNVRVTPMQDVADGINAARLLLPRCWFDAAKCADGIAALREYRREWDERLKTYKPRPRHDWSSHAADAFRTGAMATRPAVSPRRAARERFAGSPGAWMG